MPTKTKAKKTKAPKRETPAKPVRLQTFTVELTSDEIHMLTEGLDAKVYWDLSEEHYRNSGYVMDPGSDDEDTATEIAEYQALGSRLEKVVPR